MQWPIITFSLCISSSIFLVGAPYAADRQEAYSFYQFMRENTHEEFKKAIKDLLSAPRLESSPTTDKTFEVAVNNTAKWLFYNKAYIAAQCVQLAPKGENQSKFLHDCSHERLQALARIFRQSLTLTERRSTAQLAEACFVQARLTEAEEQFPPYDFLAGPSTYLFNVKQLEGCLARLSR